MNRVATPSRTQHDAFRARRTWPRAARDTWASVAAPHAVRPTAASEAAVAECRCPTDCIRDHENE